MNTITDFKNFSLKSLLRLFVILPLLLTGCQLSFSVPSLEEVLPVDGSNQASFVMNTMATGQQAYYEANGHSSRLMQAPRAAVTSSFCQFSGESFG